MAVQNFRVRNSIDILGTSLNTESTTFNLLDTTATTVNLSRAATNITVGATTGTLTLRNPIIVGNATSQDLFNTTATTLNFAGAATTLAIGNSTSSTVTLRPGTLVGSNTTQSVYDTVATTVNAFGAATTLTLGNATSATVTIRPGTVVGSNTTQSIFDTVATTVNAFGVAETLRLGANNSGTTTIRTSTTAVQNALTVGTTATVTTSTTSPIIQGSTANSGQLTIRSTSSATKATSGVLLTDGIASTSNTTGTLVVTGGVGISGNLNVGGDITADGDIFIKAKDGSGGTITLGQGDTDSVNIQADISSNLLPDGSTQDIGSATKKWRGLFLSGTADLTTLTVSGNSTLTGNLTVNGNTIIGDTSADTLTVNATPTFAAATQINNTLAVTGAVTLSGSSPTITNATAGSTASIFDTTVPTIFFGRAATSITIGATTGTTTIKHSLKVDGGLDVTGNLTFLGQPSWTEKTILLRDVSGGGDIQADGGGILLKGSTNYEILWSNTNDAWTINQNFFPKTDNTYTLGSSSFRFSNGYFTTITGALVGNSSTATTLQTARTINGVSFDGSANISFSTSSVSEGTNLYYTDERVDDRVNALIVAGTGIQRTYDDLAGSYTLALDFTEFSTTNITEGTNQYFTTARARSSISASGSLSYSSSTGVISYTTPSTDGITEGSTNLYFTTTRANTAIDSRVTTTYINNLNGVISDQVSFVPIPATSTSTGTTGQLAQDATYLYVCVATDSWKRIAWDVNAW